MKKEVIGRCPVCNNSLQVSKLNCPSCKITIEGDFTLCKFCNLSNEQKQFLEIFVKNRGNIREIEKEMGISYPTVKNKIEDLIEGLGYRPQYNVAKVNKMEVLEKLNKGEITSEEALSLLKEE